MFGPGELFVRNDAVLVLVLVTEDLLYEFVLIGLHLVSLVCLGSTCGPDLLNLKVTKTCLFNPPILINNS